MVRTMFMTGRRSGRANGSERHIAADEQSVTRDWSTVAGLGLGSRIPQRSMRLMVGLAALATTIWVNVRTLHPEFQRSGAEALAALTVAGSAWLVSMAATPGGAGSLAALAVLGAAGGVLSNIGPAGWIVVGVAAAGAAVADDLFGAASVAGAALCAFSVAALAHGSFPGRLAPTAAVCLLGLVSGAGRRQILERTRQATLLSVANERADVARREAAVESERNRLARELHDVLAHTLGALSIQLSALDALVEHRDGPGQLREQIEHTHKLVDEGLDEAHQAIRALRERPRALVDELARLCRQHDATFKVSGTPSPISAEAHLALFRAAQEALTNSARHAPGAPVAVEADFHPDAATLTIRNGRGSPPATSHRGEGYGLAGMSERVRLAGGRCEAGPMADGWQVIVEVPT